MLGRRSSTKVAAPSKTAASRPTTGRVTPRASARYTPPIPKELKTSPRWVPWLMFTLIGLGAATIVLNYLGVVPGGHASNWYLLGGLGLITAGFITATQYR